MGTISNRVTEWVEVQELDLSFSLETKKALDRADSFRDRWREMLVDADPEEVQERRNRNLRRHAIETGIIERLYDVSWGVTEELVAEGITLDAAEREGDVSEDTLATINAQLDGLNLLVDYVNENREFSSFFLRTLHETITSTQEFYDAHDTLGRPIKVRLLHGAWKTNENHVTRPDGSILEYTPALFVSEEIDRIAEMYNRYALGEAHPLAVAAWLHHRFIRVHPFADGNGRVARALTLLVLLQKEYAPIVVRRDQREEYIEALDRANDGDLEVLIRFFARLEEYAITAELESAPKHAGSTAVQVAAEWAKRLKAKFEHSDAEKKAGIERLSEELQSRLLDSIHLTESQLREQFGSLDERYDSWVVQAAPPAEESHYWRAETIRAAREVDFFTNIQNGTWWITLSLKLLGGGFRFGAVFQKVGHGETGIGALSFFSETFAPRNQTVSEEQVTQGQSLLRLRSNDGVRYLHTDNVDDVWGEVEDAVNRTLTASLGRYLDMLG